MTFTLRYWRISEGWRIILCRDGIPVQWADRGQQKYAADALLTELAWAELHTRVQEYPSPETLAELRAAIAFVQKETGSSLAECGFDPIAEPPPDE